MTTPKLSSWKMNIIVQPVTSMRPVSLDTSASIAQMTETITDRKPSPVTIVMGSVEKRLEKLLKMAKGSKDAKAAAEIMQQLLAALNDGKPASTFALPENEAFLQSWRELGLLTAKPVIYCANVDENAVADGNELSQRVQALAAERNAGFARICAKLEEELQGLPDDEQAEMLSSYGIDESGLVRIIRTGYDTLGLCSYFTAGPDEVRAWTIHKGWKAPQAAGVIHTDFERGFIRAEVISYADYMSHESEAACRSDGVLRVEGKEYVVQDGDVMHFLFNV